MNIGEKIDLILKQKGVSIKDFIEGVGMKRTSFYEYKNGTNMKIETLLKAAKFLDVQVEELVEDQIPGLKEVIPHHKIPKKLTAKEKKELNAQKVDVILDDINVLRAEMDELRKMMLEMVEKDKKRSKK